MPEQKRSKVYLIPLAAKGFVPRDPSSNSVRWYLEDEQGNLLKREDGLYYSWLTAGNARAWGEQEGYEVAN